MSKSRFNGIKEYTLNEWNEFHNLIVEKINGSNYVFRGQKNSDWKLEPTLNRSLKYFKVQLFEKHKKTHLERFKKSLRGRTSFYKDIIQDEKEVWAIGQHNFLDTPLLDFTESPYVAAYFAFAEESTDSDFRIVYAISKKNIIDNHSDNIEIFTPVSDYNNRLISQSGLFVNFKIKKDLEKQIVEKYQENKDGKIKLFKIKIPNSEREKCLLSLNKMNINHNTLFPDLYGAALYCNMELKILKY